MLWTAAGILLPAAFVIWPFLGTPDRIVVSRETTWLGEEAVVQGKVDYATVVADQLLAAGVPDIDDDPWMRQAGPYPKSANGWQRLDWRLLPGGSYTSIEPASLAAGISSGEWFWRRPWSEADYPGVAEIVEGNAQWYSTVSSDYTTLTPVDWSVTESGKPFSTSSLMGPANEINEAFADRFLLRAAQRFGSSRPAAAISDIRFVQMIAARHRMDNQAATRSMRIEARISRLVVRSLLTPELWSPDLLTLVLNLPAESTLDEFPELLQRDRLRSLDAVQGKRNGQTPLYALVPWSGAARLNIDERLRARRIRINTDWNAVMRAQNQFYDRMQSAMQQSDPATMLSAARLLMENVDHKAGQEITQRSLWEPVPTTQEIIAVYAAGKDWEVQCLGIAIRRDLHRQVIRLAALLSEYRHRTGDFPETLEQLRSVHPDGPLPELWLIDPFSGDPLEYERAGDGFTLRSVGYNQVRDLSEFCELEEQRHEFAKAGQDLVWRWPPADQVTAGSE